MLSLSPAVKIFLATEPADMRKSVDGLMGLVEELLEKDPYSGFLFVFRNRRSNRIKILAWDHGGFWIHYKRLEKGQFRLPEVTGSSVQIQAAELSSLLAGIDLSGARRLPRWNPPPPPEEAPPKFESRFSSGFAS
jgi:transposase